MLSPGDIVRYGYLWAREAEGGEISGRKTRPVCIVVRSGADPGVLFLFPLTSQQPSQERAHLAITQIECRRGGLDFPSYLILDEYNRALTDALYDLEPPAPIGSFSPAYLRKIAGLIKNAAARARIRAVSRS